MTQSTKIRRALISVSDKEGLVERAKALVGFGIELVSTGGTSRALKEAGLDVKDVADLTGYPEMMDGRVKTLHPAVHGGLLYLRDNDSHKADAEKHGIEAIDLVYINLYPFEATVASGAGFEDCIENIDIGGPAMLRAAAKNGDFVSVCTDGGDLDAVLAEMASTGGRVSRETSRKLAAKTYARTAAYDAAISGWYAKQLGDSAPDWVGFGGKLNEALRYGENPHQKAAFYVTSEARPGVATARQVQGKALSYNNINDTDAAYELIGELGDETPAVAIIKHANPCGVALGNSVIEAYREALACDSTSAFGGIVALNRPLDEATAQEITSIFTEVVIAPGADEAAIEVFKKKKNILESDNYRRITITPIIGKVLEKIIVQPLKEILKPKINKLQRGFCEHSSSVNTAFLLTEAIAEAKDQNIPLFAASLMHPRHLMWYFMPEC